MISVYVPALSRMPLCIVASMLGAPAPSSSSTERPPLVLFQGLGRHDAVGLVPDEDLLERGAVNHVPSSRVK